MQHGLKMAATTFLLAVACGSCSAPPPGNPITDGCYYADDVAVLKVQGERGMLLVPGNIHTVAIARDASAEQSSVTFTPGFHLRKGPPITATLVTSLPHSSMMMKPYSESPTIMAIADPMGLIDLVQGPPC